MSSESVSRTLLLALSLALPVMTSAAQAPALTVDADHSLTTIDSRADTSQTTYTGRVVIRQGTTVIHGARAVVHTHHQRLDKAVVSGKPATFSVQPSADERPVHGRADRITYQVKRNTLVLEGHANLRRDGQTFRAARVRYNLDTRMVKARGNDKERVHVEIPPQQSARGAPASASPHT